MDFSASVGYWSLQWFKAIKRKMKRLICLLWFYFKLKHKSPNYYALSILFSRILKVINLRIIPLTLSKVFNMFKSICLLKIAHKKTNNQDRLTNNFLLKYLYVMHSCWHEFHQNVIRYFYNKQSKIIRRKIIFTTVHSSIRSVFDWIYLMKKLQIFNNVLTPLSIY